MVTGGKGAGDGSAGDGVARWAGRGAGWFCFGVGRGVDWEVAPCPIKRLVSGGQSGADRAALDAALGGGLPCGGWCPKGRRAEDGTIPDRYPMSETTSAGYSQRTEWNVRDSDGTVVLTLGAEPVGGSLETIGLARRWRKPCLHIAKDRLGGAGACDLVRDFVGRHRIEVLNVAGSRESEEPGISAWARGVIGGVLGAP